MGGWNGAIWIMMKPCECGKKCRCGWTRDVPKAEDLTTFMHIKWLELNLHGNARPEWVGPARVS